MLKVSAADLRQISPTLFAGQRILFTGMVYTARDAAHKRFAEALDRGEALPIDLTDAIVYYAGPTPAKPGMPIGSCGPTTSGRMDVYAGRLLDLGLCAMIGKGERSMAVREAIVRNGAVYFCAVGGAGALACKCIKSCEVVAYEDLGCESVKRLYLQDFPLIVANDCEGGDIFTAGKKEYARR